MWDLKPHTDAYAQHVSFCPNTFTGKKTKLQKQGHPWSEGPGLTLEEQGLAEVAAHVIPTHSLDTEQVKAVRRDMANDGFLRVKEERVVSWF